jgi:hypothetical protein
LNLHLGNWIKDDSRKGAKNAKFGETGKYFTLQAWRLGAKNFLEVVLLNIQSVRIENPKSKF